MLLVYKYLHGYLTMVASCTRGSDLRLPMSAVCSDKKHFYRKIDCLFLLCHAFKLKLYSHLFNI